jgi:hypothetical protein
LVNVCTHDSINFIINKAGIRAAGSWVREDTIGLVTHCHGSIAASTTTAATHSSWAESFAAVLMCKLADAWLAVCPLLLAAELVGGMLSQDYSPV